MKRVGRFLGRYWLDFLLIFIAILVSIFVRLGSIVRDNERFKFVCFPETSEECVDEFYDEDGNPYLFELDSYYYLRQAKVIIEGEVGDYKRGQISVIAVLLALVYKVFNVFSEVSLVSIAAVIGPIVFSLSCIPVYIFIRKRTNRVGGFTAALFAGICAPFVNYASFARFDTDILLFLLPSLTMICYILALEAKEKRKRIKYIGIGLLSFLVLALTWGSHAVYFYLAVLIGVALFFVELLRERFKIGAVLKKKSLKVGAIYVGGLLVICLAVYPNALLSKAAQIFSWLTDGLYSTSLGENVYPDGQRFVSELSPASVLNGGWLGLVDASELGVVNWFSGITMVVFIAVVFSYLVYKVVKYMVFREEESSETILYMALIVWVFGTVLPAVRGVRFMKEPMIPVALLVGFGMGLLYRRLKQKKMGIVRFCALWLIVLAPGFSVVYSFKDSVPVVDDTTWETSRYVRENFDDSFAVISWWDLGYYFVYESQHEVASDGGSLAEARYWTAEALMSKDEEYAAGIFKMLANFALSDGFFGKLEEAAGGQLESVRIIKRIAPLRIYTAFKALREEFGLSEERAIKIVAALKGEKKAVVVVSKRMETLEEVMGYYHCFSFLRQESECPAEEEGNEELQDNVGALGPEGEMRKLELGGGGNRKTILERIYNGDEKLKRFSHGEVFADEFGINRMVVVFAE